MFHSAWRCVRYFTITSAFVFCVCFFRNILNRMLFFFFRLPFTYVYIYFVFYLFVFFLLLPFWENRGEFERTCETKNEMQRESEFVVSVDFWYSVGWLCCHSYSSIFLRHTFVLFFVCDPIWVLNASVELARCNRRKNVHSQRMSCAKAPTINAIQMQILWHGVSMVIRRQLTHKFIRRESVWPFVQTKSNCLFQLSIWHSTMTPKTKTNNACRSFTRAVLHNIFTL